MTNSKPLSMVKAIKKIEGWEEMQVLRLVAKIKSAGIPTINKVTGSNVRAALEKIKAKQGKSASEEKAIVPRKVKTKTADKKPAKKLKKTPMEKAKEQSKKAAKSKLKPITFGKTTTPGFECLSNMFPCAIYVKVGKKDYRMFYSAEQLFQWLKTTDEEFRTKIGNCMKPKDARHFGSERAGCPMREDWHDIREEVMGKILLGKFSQNMPMRKILLSSGELPLFEIAPWDKEKFWGVSETFEGENTTARLLEEIRKQFSKPSYPLDSFVTPDISKWV